MRDAPGTVLLAGLEASRRQPKVGGDSAGTFEAGWLIDRRLEAQRRDLTNAGHTHEPGADLCITLRLVSSARR